MTHSREPRSQRRTVADYLLATETFLLLTLATALIRVAPFQIITWSAGLRVVDCTDQANRAQTIARVRRVVPACARRLPWHPQCFPQGLAAQWMLHRRGVGSTLHCGAARDEGGVLIAHVWVSYEKEPIVGARYAGQFTRFVSLP
jgi:hypothetical protein